MSKVPVEVVGPPVSAGFGLEAATPAEPAIVADATVSATVPSPDFASDEAAELWINHNQPALPPTPGGKHGYTVADVRAALKEV
jgi:hypothetical protein